MEEFFDATVSWVHILSAVVFIGPQVFLVAAAIPAIRSVEDAGQRARALRTVTTRFAILGGVALALLLATGIWNYYEADDQGLIDADAFPRYYAVLFTKLTLVTIVIVLSVLHGAVFGRRLLEHDKCEEHRIHPAHRTPPSARTGTSTISVFPSTSVIAWPIAASASR